MEKIRIKFVGGINPKSTKEVWGGSKATFNSIVKSFKKDKEIDFIYKTRTDFVSVEECYEFLNGGDISHVDDTGVVATLYNKGYSTPDIIGPIVRSPIKNYHGWSCPYEKDWFYRAKVIRLNYNEERKNHELVNLIRHGIDTNFLKPSNKKKKYILWAGMIQRYAKNYGLMEEIMKLTKLPKGYEFKVMNKYDVEDYWKVLDETAILINTSRYESFCCALFEARAKGVATIQPKLLNGKGVHEKAPIQVEYMAEAYRDKILNLLKNEHYKIIGKECRKYCEKNASLKIMRDDIVKIYREALYGKK